MGTHTLENRFLRVTVADQGAELISVYDKERGRERIWTGEPAIWNRHAPILFPFVGKVVGGRYRIGNREYAMQTQHGFARDLEFSCVSETESEITHRLEDNDWTREHYPYAFLLSVSHKLEGKQLRVAWTVENRGEERMFFSIGAHPGFLLPEGVKKEDCSILFPEAGKLYYMNVSKAGYALPEKKELVPEEGRVLYREDIPDTWIFEDSQVGRVGIAAPDGQPYVYMDCARFPMLAVWANPVGPFICLEPWFGRTDDEGFDGTIDRKKGVQSLGGGEKREISYRIEFC